MSCRVRCQRPWIRPSLDQCRAWAVNSLSEPHSDSRGRSYLRRRRGIAPWGNRDYTKGLRDGPTAERLLQHSPRGTPGPMILNSFRPRAGSAIRECQGPEDFSGASLPVPGKPPITRRRAPARPRGESAAPAEGRAISSSRLNGRVGALPPFSNEDMRAPEPGRAARAATARARRSRSERRNGEILRSLANGWSLSMTGRRRTTASLRMTAFARGGSAAPARPARSRARRCSR